MMSDDLVLLQEAVQLTTAGHHRKALAYLKQYLARVREQNDPYGEYTALLNTGVVFLRLHEPRKALTFLNESVRMIRTLIEHNTAANPQQQQREEVTTARHVQSAGEAIGPSFAAEEDTLHSGKSSGRRRTTRKQFTREHLRRSEAKALTTIGAVYALLGMRDTAMQYQREALQIGYAETDGGGGVGSSSERVHERDVEGDVEKCGVDDEKVRNDRAAMKRLWGGVLSAACHNLALIESEQGHYAEAFQLLDEAVLWAEASSDDAFLGTTTNCSPSRTAWQDETLSLGSSLESAELQKAIVIVRQRHQSYHAALQAQKIRTR